MAPSVEDHNRQRQLLLFQKLLNQRQGASPLTLVLDTLEQPATPIITEFVLRAKRAAKAKIISVTFSTLKKCPHADVHVSTRGKSLAAVRTELMNHYPRVTSQASEQKALQQRALVIIDSLNPLAPSTPDALLGFLTNIITPAVSLVATYHADVPTVMPKTFNEYAPDPLTLLTYLATAILRLSNLDHEVERQKARNRSVREPDFGLDEGREGILIGMTGRKAPGAAARGSGLVVEMEVRKRSGRGLTGTFVVEIPPEKERRGGALGTFCLREEYPAFAPPKGEDDGKGPGGQEEPESTFDLGLTEKQRKDREGIVLPYFDAQTDIGGGEGGRILYDMGREDDFDEEDDEI